MTEVDKMWKEHDRDTREGVFKNYTYLAQRKRGEPWDIFRFNETTNGELVASGLTTREVTTFDPDFDVFVLSVRDHWEGNFGDSESALVFHSCYNSYEGAKCAAENENLTDSWEYSISRAKIHP